MACKRNKEFRPKYLPINLKNINKKNKISYILLNSVINKQIKKTGHRSAVLQYYLKMFSELPACVLIGPFFLITFSRGEDCIGVQNGEE